MIKYFHGLGIAVLFGSSFFISAQAEDDTYTKKYADFYKRIDACLAQDVEPVCDDVAKEILADTSVKAPLANFHSGFRVGKRCISEPRGTSCFPAARTFLATTPEDDKRSATGLYFLAKSCEKGRTRQCQTYETIKASLTPKN